jgi:hypothetical protein
LGCSVLDREIRRRDRETEREREGVRAGLRGEGKKMEE